VRDVSLVHELRRCAGDAVAPLDDTVLAAVIERWLVEAKATWPGVAVDDTAFVGYVGARVTSSIDAIHATDLWLALACANGDGGACELFDRQMIARLRPVLGQFGLSADELDETLQKLRAKLLVGDGDGPRIVDYSGRADLRMWLRTIAVRAAIDLRRGHRDAQADDDELAAQPGIADDPELIHLRDRYRDELAAAVTTAIRELDARDRLLLKYHYLDGLTVDRIGAMYTIHRATAARWVAAARETLATHTQRILIDKLRVTPSELRSIARLVESMLDLSMRRLLC
jgi:RNA polymerase sigma-70 factor (ECF subfamily)